jgi:hypothetical protein
MPGFGTVSFKNGTTLLGTVTLNGTGQATFTTTLDREQRCNQL